MVLNNFTSTGVIISLADLIISAEILSGPEDLPFLSFDIALIISFVLNGKLNSLKLG